MSLPHPAKIAIATMLVAAFGSAIYLYTRNEGHGPEQTTTDAYVITDSTFVASKVAGNILEAHVEDNQYVRKGQLLATIDDRDFVVAVESAKADLANAQAEFARLNARIQQQGSAVKQAAAGITADSAATVFAQANLERYSDLSTDGSATMQEKQQADSQLRIAQARGIQSSAARDSAQQQIAVLEAEKQQAQAHIAKAQAALHLGELNLSYTKVVAPIDGMVGQRKMRVGAYVHVGAPLLAVVPLQQAYVEANFRETQLERIRPGQPVTIKVDMLPGTVLKGHVESISPASGVAFSAIAPDNATGNFTKVVQRLPVKITLDPGQAATTALRVGMSVIPTVHVAEKSPAI